MDEEETHRTGSGLDPGDKLFPACIRYVISQNLIFTGPDGLAAEATFSFDTSTPSTLTIVLTNTSTGVPASFLDNPNKQLVTTIAFPLPGSIIITGGTATITSGSSALNFTPDTGGDVSKEWGFGNSGGGQCCPDFESLSDWVSTNIAGTTQFAAGNLGGAAGLNGPDYGLVANTIFVPPIDPDDGTPKRAIQNSATFVLSLTGGTLSDLNFLIDNGVVVEFGSDAALVPIPEPSTLLLLGVGLGALGIRARRRHPRT